jgi:hypothetical protein
MERFITYFRYSNTDLQRDESGNLIVGRGESLEEARESLVSQITERDQKIIETQEYRLEDEVMTEHGFYAKPHSLPSIPPKQDGWDSWCLVIFTAYYDDSTQQEARGYLYVPKGTVIKRRLGNGQVEKIKVGASGFQSVWYHIDDWDPYELPNASFIWTNGKWKSLLTFGG